MLLASTCCKRQVQNSLTLKNVRQPKQRDSHLNASSALRAPVLVWMQLQGQLPVCPLDVIIAGIPLDPQHIIMVLLRQDLRHLQPRSSEQVSLRSSYPYLVPLRLGCLRASTLMACKFEPSMMSHV